MAYLGATARRREELRVADPALRWTPLPVARVEPDSAQLSALTLVLMPEGGSAIARATGRGGYVALAFDDVVLSVPRVDSPVTGQQLTIWMKRRRSAIRAGRSRCLADGIEGTVAETITGLRATPTLLSGAFALRRLGPLTGIVHAPDFTPEAATAPDWLAPPGLDTGA